MKQRAPCAVHNKASFGPPHLDFQTVRVALGDSSRNSPVPPIPVPALREYRRRPLKLHVVSSDLRSPHVAFDQELLHELRRLAGGYVVQRLVEGLELVPAARVVHNSTVLS